MAKASIIIPTFNCEDYIKETIESVLIQTEQDWELLIVDDGSTDRTLDIIDRFSEKDPRIRIHAQVNSGRPACPRNVGLMMAKGKYVCFLDNDDQYHPQRLQRAIEIMDQLPEVDLTFNVTKKFTLCPDETNDLVPIGGDEFFGIANDKMVFLRDGVYLCNENYYVSMSVDICGMHTSGITIRKQAIDAANVRFLEDLMIADDIDFWFQIAKNGRVVYLREILSYWRQRPTSASRNRVLWGWEMARTHERNLRRASSVFDKTDLRRYREKISFMYFTLGYGLFCQGRKSEARKAYANALRMHLNANTLFAVAKSFIPHQMVKRYQRNKLKTGSSLEVRSNRSR